MSVDHLHSSERGPVTASRHSLLAAVILMAITLLASFGWHRLRLDASPDALIAQDVATRQAYQQVVREFGSDLRSYLLIRESEWSSEKLDALAALHDELLRQPSVERVEDLFSIAVLREQEGQLTIGSLARDLMPGSASAHSPSEIGESRLLHRVFGREGKSLAIAVVPREEASSDANAALNSLAARYRAKLPSLLVLGPQDVGIALRNALANDLLWLAGASLGMLLLVVLLLTRRMSTALESLGVAALSLAWTAGAMGFLNVPLGLLGSAGPVLVVAIVAAYATLGGGVRSTSTDGKAVSRFDGASLAAGIVAAVGLLGQWFSGFPAMTHLILGLVLALCSALLAGYLVARAAMPWRRPVKATVGLGKFPGFVSRLALSLAERSRPRASLVAGILMLALLAGAAVLGLRGVTIEHSPLAVLGEQAPAPLAAQRLHREVEGGGVFFVRLDAYAEGAFRDPGNLQRLADIQSFIDRQQVFDGSVSLADFVAQAHQEASGGRGIGTVQLPANRRLVERYLVLFPPAVLSPYVSKDYSRALIVVRHDIRDAQVLSAHVRELRSVVAQLGGPSMTTLVTGKDLLLGESIHSIMQYGVLTTLIVLLAAWIIFSMMFTSLLAGLVVALANLAAVLFAWLFLSLLSIPLSLMTTIGIVFSGAISSLACARLFSAYSEFSRRAHGETSPLAAVLAQELPQLGAALVACMAVSACILLSELALLRHLGVFLFLSLASSFVVVLCVVPMALACMRLVGLYDILAIAGRGREVAESPLFSGFSSYQIRKTILLSELREFRDGERVIEQATLDNSMYLLLSGKVVVIHHADDGERLVASLGPGDVFGEIGFVRETYRTADVQAVGAVTVLRFEYQRLKRDLVLFPSIMAKLNFNICGILGKRLAETVGKPGG